MKNAYYMSMPLVILAMMGVAFFVSPATTHGGGYPLDRPAGADGGPTVIKYAIYVIDIDDIDGANQNFATNFFLKMQWNDPRLKIQRDITRRAKLSEVWNPSPLLVNKQGIVRKSLQDVVEIQADGTVTYRQRYVGTLSQPLKLTDFPFDTHDFTIRFAAPTSTHEEVKFVPMDLRQGKGIVGGGIAKELSLPDWKVQSILASDEPYEIFPGTTLPGFGFRITAKREYQYYIWQMILPLILIVMMAWTAFWIDPSNAGAQIGVATSAMLTLIAFRFMLGNLTPRLAYMTRLDQFIFGSTLLVFLTLMEVVITATISRAGRNKLARKIDWISRFFFPSVFAALLFFTLLA